MSDGITERLTRNGGEYHRACNCESCVIRREAKAEIELLRAALQLEKEQRAFIQKEYDKLNEWQTRQATKAATAKDGTDAG